jgi:hypothetical protein
MSPRRHIICDKRRMVGQMTMRIHQMNCWVGLRDHRHHHYYACDANLQQQLMLHQINETNASLNDPIIPHYYIITFVCTTILEAATTISVNGNRVLYLSKHLRAIMTSHRTPTNANLSFHGDYRKKQ